MAISPAPPALYLVGPTAVGKSDIAVEVAVRLRAEIVSCDAYQIYQGLPILTAQPSPDLLARVRHHLIGEVALSESMDVARYLRMATERMACRAADGKPLLVVGGTGMYLRALTRGLADLPSADSALRQRLVGLGTDELLERLEELDPVTHSRIDRQNRQRVTRALEVCLITGRPFSSFQSQWNSLPQNVRGVLLHRPSAELNQRIEKRVAAMFSARLLAEVRDAENIGPTAALTLGLREVQEVLDGAMSDTEATERICIATRQYAKRQMTWFRRETWLQPIEVRGDLATPELVDQIHDALLAPPNDQAAGAA